MYYQNASKSSYYASYYANRKEKQVRYLNEEKGVELEEKTLIGSDGSEYFFKFYLDEEIGKRVEKETGILLKQEENGKRFSSFLGGGAFGKFYVIQKKSKNEEEENEICGVKIITGKLEDNLIEAEMQRDLSKGIPDDQESRLMPIFDVIQEKNSEGKLIELNLIMPLASFGNVTSLKEKLKEEKDIQLKRLVMKLIVKDLLIGIWQMHCQNYYHLDIKLDNMVITSKGNYIYFCIIIYFLF